MARDRLADLRGAAQPYANSQSSPLYSDGGLREAYDDNNSHEMSPFSNPGGFDDLSAFLAEIQRITKEIQGMRDNVDSLSSLHSTYLNATDDYTSSESEKRVTSTTMQTRQIMKDLQADVKALMDSIGPGNDRQTRIQQAERVKKNFMEAIQYYQEEERQYRLKSKNRFERQYRIVKPDATQDEIRSAAEADDSQVFAQALMNTNRYGDSREVNRVVGDRKKEMEQIERTVRELAELFNEMSLVVARQDDQIDAVERNAYEANQEIETGLGHTEKAVDSARAARKKRWICFWITVIILAIVAIVVGVVVAQNVNKTKTTA